MTGPYTASMTLKSEGVDFSFVDTFDDHTAVEACFREAVGQLADADGDTVARATLDVTTDGGACHCFSYCYDRVDACHDTVEAVAKKMQAFFVPEPGPEPTP
jgi:hypothetical protein